MSIIDAHMHIFDQPYSDLYNNSHIRQGEEGELHLYEEYRRDTGIEGAFVICYEGDSRYAGNNGYVERIKSGRPWIHSFGHMNPNPGTMRKEAQKLNQRGHFGLSCYLDRDDSCTWMASDEMDSFWQYIEEERMPLSLNISANQCGPLAEALARHPGATVLISHMGRPKVSGGRLDEADYAPLLNLAGHEGACVKLSGFYAFVEDGWRWPQKPLFAAVDRLKSEFGAERLLFATDFPPVLEHNSIRQTIALLKLEYTGFTESEQQAIYGGNAQRIIDWRYED